MDGQDLEYEVGAWRPRGLDLDDRVKLQKYLESFVHFQ